MEKKTYYILQTKIREYRRWLKSAGGHSVRTRFYRKMIKERENEICVLIKDIINNSEIINFCYESLIAEYQALGFTEIDIVLDIIETGMGSQEDGWCFDDLVVIGAISIAIPVGLVL